MKILLFIIALGLVALEFTMAEKSGVISSKKNNKAYSTNRNSNYNQTKNYNHKSNNRHNLNNTLTYDKGQQWYLDLYYKRNGYPFYNNNNHEYKFKHHYNNLYKYPYYIYPAYNYPYSYDYEYDRRYYDSRYSDQYRYEQVPVEKPGKPHVTYEPEYDYNSLENESVNNNYQVDSSEYYNSQDDSEDGVENIIYKWTDDKGIEHYTNNIKKVPEEFKHTIIETETW